jgi:phosphonopyruvate decarboxylase
MRMGALATVGACAPRNFWHLLLDNSAHESTGGQATVSASVAFADVAAACGYRSCLDTDSVAQLPDWLALTAGPHFARLLTRTGTPADLPRPTVTPEQVRERFMQHIGGVGG